jgi:hypothetical protein
MGLPPCTTGEIGLSIGGAITPPHVAYAHASEDSAHGLVAVEEGSAVSLIGVIPMGAFDLAAFLALALQLSEGLEAMHCNGIADWHLHLHHLLIDPATKVMQVTNVGLASQLRQDTPQATPGNTSSLLT